MSSQPSLFQDPKVDALRVAIQKGDKEAVEALLADGADVKATGPRGITLTHFALEPEDASILQRLVEAGADPVSRLEDGSTAPHLAAIRKGNNADHLSVFLSLGLDPNAIGGKQEQPLLIYAVYGRNHKAAELLLSHGADPNWMSDFDGTALHMAMIEKDYALASLLLKAGADPRLSNEDTEAMPVYYCKTIQLERLGENEQAEAAFKAVDDLMAQLHGIRFPCRWNGQPH